MRYKHAALIHTHTHSYIAPSAQRVYKQIRLRVKASAPASALLALFSFIYCLSAVMANFYLSSFLFLFIYLIFSVILIILLSVGCLP